MVVINLERGMPTCDQALINLRNSIAAARARGTNAIKIIHGYGSSGKGGAIKQAVLRELEIQKENGRIKSYAKGEEFSPFYPAGRAVIASDYSLTKDSDYGRTNQGITIIIVK